MTISEILKAKGISDDVIKGVLEDMKANKVFTASEENLDIRYGKLKTDHEGVTKQLQQELEESKIDAAIKVGLLSEKALDVDYLTFKLKNKGEALTLGEDGKIKGWDDKIAALKTQCPTQFESSGKKNIVENKLPDPEDHSTLSKTDLLKKPYAERQKIFEENPEAFRAAMEQ